LRIGFGTGQSARVTTVGYVTDLLYAETLLTRGWDGRQSPRLLTGWSWEDGGRALRMQLKENVLFHDGTPLSAALVADLLQPRTPADWGFENVTEVAARGDREVSIRLSRPDLFLLNGLADRKIVHPSNPDLGTGPFVLLQRRPTVEARRFAEYHAGPSALSGVSITPYDRSRSVWSALMRDEVDAAHEVNLDSVDFMQKSSSIKTFPTIQPFYIALVFNLRHHALADVEVRRAIAQAIDRQNILDRAMRGRGRLADSPIWPSHWAYQPSAQAWSYAPESARARLDKASFRVKPGVRPGEVRRRFKLRCLVFSEEPQYERIALMMQRQLLEVGIELEIELADLKTLAARAAQGDFDTYLMRLNAGRSMDFTYRAWRSGLASHLLMQDSGYTGADSVLDRLRSSLTEPEIRSAVSELALRFHDDVPAVFLSWLEVTRAVNTRFDIDTDSPDPMSDIRNWKPVAETR
jgi:peptide/nickel transport system substrate-binding protein